MADHAAARDWLCHADAQVSAHYIISARGEVDQLVDEDARAWHAGASRFRGRSRCNDCSIGIELEGTDDIPYDERQYTALVSLLAALLLPTLMKNF